MAAPSKTEEPCSFKILELKVTDDINAIGSAYDQVVSDHRGWDNSTDTHKRLHYKKIMTAGSDLKDDQKRRNIIKFHTDAFFEYVKEFIGGRTEKVITPENYDFLVRQGQKDPYHLSPDFAKKIVDDEIRVWGGAVEGRNRRPPPPSSPPALVMDLAISGDKGYPHLRWKTPDKGCERIRVLAKYEGLPSNDKDGREVFNGLGTECLDEKAKPASTCYYAIFSYSDGQSSSPASTKGQYFFAVGVEELKGVPGLERIEISWQKPAFKYDEIVVFRAPAGSLDIDYKKNQFPIPGNNETISKRIGKSYNFVENSQSGAIIPGKPYEYMIFVDYGMIGQRREFSIGQSVTVNAVPAARPVRNLQLRSAKEGLLLTWEWPRGLCDKVIVVRSKRDDFPKDERDGKAVELDRDDHYLDIGLVAGTTYFYSVFSVHQGYASACVTAKKLYAGPVLDFRSTDPLGNPGHIGLSWTLPKNASALKLFRKRGGDPETKEDKGELKIAPGEELALPPGTPTTFQDKVEAGVEYYYSLHVRYTDGQWSPPESAHGHALEPARKVADVRAAVTSAGDVRLEWTDPDRLKARYYQYRVWRRKKPVAGAGALGERKIGETKTTGFADGANSHDHDPPVPGAWYQYAVQSVVGPVAAAISEWAEVFVTKDVALKNAIGMNGSVLLEWTPHPNAKRILVQRLGDSKVVPSDLYRATDTGLTNGESYSYKVTAIFMDSAGKEFRSPGVIASAIPVSPAEPVQSLRVKYESGVVKVCWELPPKSIDKIMVSRLEAPPAAKVGDSFDASNISSSIELSGDAVLYEDKTAKIGNVYYYAVYTLRGATATFCGYVQVPLLGQVQSLSARNQRGEIWLQWKWPDGIEIVRVYRKRASSAGETVKVCTRGQYTSLGFFVDKIPTKPDQYIYQVRSVRSEGEKRIESLLFAEVTVVGGALPKITYAVRKRKSEVEVKCSLPDVGANFCGLDLVWNDSRDPLSPDDGEIVDRFRPNGKRLPKEVTLRDKHPSGRGYYKVFLTEPDRKKQMVDLINPPLSERKIEYY
jgi:hypothetical protein